jgi:hypothetical protein
MKVFSAKTIINLVFFPSTLSTDYDIYPVTLVSLGVGTTPNIAYQISIDKSAEIYEKAIIEFIKNKKYPDLQVQTNLRTIIIIEDGQQTDTPYVPNNNFALNNAIKNTIVVRYQNNSTSQNTYTAEYDSNCVFQALYFAFDSANLDDNVNIESIYATSNITTTDF